MPLLASTVTPRDLEVLREVARFGAVPPAALAHLFPSRGAAYVRLGALTERGFLARTTSFGQRAYQVTSKGTAAAGLRSSRATTGSTARAARLGAAAAILVPLGYRPTPAPRPGMPGAVGWFVCGKRVVAVYPSLARLTTRRARRLLTRLRIYKHTAHAIVLLSGGGITAHTVRDWRSPPVIVVTVPINAGGRMLLGEVL